MSTDMQVQSRPDTVPVIRAQVDRLDLMTRILGCESDVARAELLGVSTKAIQRARAGDQVGGRFVAKTIAALRAREAELVARNLRPAFDALFEVVVVPVGSAGEVSE